LGAQLGFKSEDWNFKRPNLIFTKSINWNQRQNHKKIKVLGLIVKIHSQEPICKRCQAIWTQLIEIIGEIEENWKLNGQLGAKLKKYMTKDKNRKDVEIWG